MNQKTTHLIAFDTRRTINMLRGIIRGIWILSYDWILESMEANGWKSESEYELKSFSKAVEVRISVKISFLSFINCMHFGFSFLSLTSNNKKGESYRASGIR